MKKEWKVISQYACGCQIREVSRHIKGGAVLATIVEYCPKHEAAPDMYEALKVAKRWLKEHLSDDHVDMEMINNTLGKADGKDEMPKVS